MSGLRLVAVADATPDDPDLEAYMRWAEELRGLRPTTLRVRRELLDRLSVHIGKPLRHVTESDLLRWEQVAVAGRAPETRRSYVSHARAFYRWALKADVVSVDPSTRLTNPKLNRALPRPMPDDALRQAVASARPKMRLMILLGAFCGLRCQEIAGLHWTDLQVGQSDPPALLVREGKGGQERVVPVPGAVLGAMVAFGRRRSGPMFYGMDGGQITANSVSRSINKYLVRNGLDFTAHQLRHRYGTTAYQLTKDLRLVQELLGHSSPNTTARYAAFDASQTVDMVKAMDAAWTGEESSSPVAFATPVPNGTPD